MKFSGCSSDGTFGPTVQGCRGDFDFTLKFEKIFLSIIPACLFTTVSIARSLWLTRRPIIVHSRVQQSVKAAAIAVYAALQLALVILSSTGREADSLGTLFISASVVDFIASLCMLALSCLDQSRSARPSILLNAYLFLTLLFDIAQSRSLWLAADGTADRAYASTFTSGLAVKALMILTESQRKTRWIQWDGKAHSPEQTTGLYGLGSLFWLNELFLSGYNKLLSLDDLFPLDNAMASEDLGRRLQAELESLSTNGKRPNLLRALAKILAIPLILPIAPRLALTGFNFCQPFLINSVLTYVQAPESERNVNSGYGLIGATIIIYSGIAFATTFYYYFQERALWMARGALAGTIYMKTTRSKISAASDSAALTLMSTDIERIRLGLLSLHDFWVSFLEVGLASWLLYSELGVAFVAPIVVVILCMASIMGVTTLSGSRQRTWMERIQKRVGLTSNVIANMKHLKISGLTEPVETFIQQLRVDELSAGGQFRVIMIISFGIGFTPALIGPAITFAFSSRTLTVERIFTSMSFLTLLTTPLTQIFQLVPPFMASLTCLKRIQSFLETSPQEDFRENIPRQHLEKSDPMEYHMLEIKGGNFGWEETKMNLKNLDIQIRHSYLTMVVGPIAAGKSTLCKALLGETPFHNGHISVERASSRHVGYCEQVPFLSNGSIRENIIGYSAFNSERYNQVVEAAMLLPDLAVLAKGDGTKVGSNGITLSGGQKQRVSIARALYLDSDFLIFDDVLSGLDADTEKQVFNRVFGPSGLIRRRKATAVLCTHSVRHLPLADHIVALDVDGNVVEQGTFEQLMANENYVHGLGVKARDKMSEDSAPSGSISITDEPVLNKTENPSETFSTAHSMISTVSTQDEDPSRQFGDSTVYKHYAKSLSPVVLVCTLIICTAVGFLFNFPQIWLNYWSVDVTSQPMTHSQSYWVGIYAMLQVCCLICLGLSGAAVFITIISQAGTSLHRQALRTLIGAPLRFFTKTDAGVVTNLFSQDMTLIDTELPQAILNVVLEIFICIGMAAVVATSSPYIAISYPFLFALLWAIQRFYLRTSRQLRLLDLEAKSPLYTHFTDTITGVATFRAFGWVSASLKLNNRLLDDSQRPAYLLAMIQRWLTFVLYMVVAVLSTLVVVLATQLKTATSSGFTGASLVTLMSFGGYAAHLIMMYTLLETSIGAVSRLKKFSDTVQPETLPEENLIPPSTWPSTGAIEMQGVSASYGLADEDDSTHLALKNLCMSIRPGEKISICGRSGSGKSSTILLLLRLLDPIATCNDKITIDGVPLHQVDRSVLRQRILAVPQDPVFLPDGTSFKANIDAFHVATDEECQDVFETVGLWKFVQERGGLDHGLSADMLSQGQKQLFSLARVILRRRIRSQTVPGGLLLLDEVSSSVDKKTDVEIQAIIKREFTGYTIIMVSHRLDMVMDFDRVFVMEMGTIIESGNPRELVKQEQSHFKELYNVAKTSASTGDED